MEAMVPGQMELLDIFATICRNIDDDKAKEVALAVRNGRCLSISETIRQLKVKAQKVDELQGQNARLQACLQDALKSLDASRKKDGQARQAAEAAAQLLSAPKGTLGGNSKVADCGPQLISPHPTTPREFSQVHQELRFTSSDTNWEEIDLSVPENATKFKDKFNRLSRKHREIGAALKIAIDKWELKRQQVKHWIAYADGLKKKLEKLEKLEQSKADQEMLRTMADCGNDTELESALPTSVNLEFHHDLRKSQQDFTSGTTESDAEDAPEPAEQTGRFNNHVHDEPVPQVKEEEDVDSPVVVSSRTINKRKDTNAVRATSVIKNENLYCSHPVGLATLPQFEHQEGLDLDEDHRQGITPRKKRRLDTRLSDKLRHQTSGRSYDLDSDKDLSSTDQHRESMALEEDRQGQQLSSTATSPYRESSLSRRALKPRSPNKMIPAVTEAMLMKRDKLDDRLQGAVIFGEDGEENILSRRAEAKLKGRILDGEQTKRLDGLLEVPSPQRAILTTPRAGHKEESLLRRPAGLIRDCLGSLPSHHLHIDALHKDDKSVRASTINENQQGISTSSIRQKETKTNASTTIPFELNDASHEPFRARPLHKLTLEHFKVNPAYNQGLDFAFSDVVRGREKRKCLAGCTKPDCCGDKFRKMAEVMRDNKGEPTLSQEEADQELMEDFMGHNHGKIATMTDEERLEVLLQAKANELSRKHGKHRSVYERRKSPPGFWRTDFPTTQEAKDDRTEAAKAERELVEKRYNEAMREGGKWLFRDE